MRKLLISLFIFISSCSQVFATQISYPTIWSVNDTVTNVKLNNNDNAVSNVVNGNIDNGNIATGYSLYQTVSVLPSAGNQGRVFFLTSDNSLNLDTGGSFVKTITPAGVLATGQIPCYNSGWQLCAPGAQNLPLVSNGTSSLPTYQLLALSGGGTGQDLSMHNQGDIYYDNGTTNGFTRLTPGTSGQLLQTQGSSANPQWVTPVWSPTNIQVFATPGTATWTKPSGVGKVYVKIWGAGASGGSHNTTSGGGGGGGYTEGFVTVTGDVTVNVGTGGVAVSGGSDGNSGTASSFAGSTTPTANGGAAGTTSNGAGGTSSNGSVNISGGPGIGGGIASGGYSPFAGAGGASLSSGGYPGSGGGASTAAAASGAGKDGLVIVYY